jgi:hypothetical protein
MIERQMLFDAVLSGAASGAEKKEISNHGEDNCRSIR